RPEPLGDPALDRAPGVRVDERELQRRAARVDDENRRRRRIHGDRAGTLARTGAGNHRWVNRQDAKASRWWKRGKLGSGVFLVRIRTAALRTKMRPWRPGALAVNPLQRLGPAQHLERLRHHAVLVRRGLTDDVALAHAAVQCDRPVRAQDDDLAPD